MNQRHWTLRFLTFSSSSCQSLPCQQDPQCRPCCRTEPFPVLHDSCILDVAPLTVEQSRNLQNESSNSCPSSQIFFQEKTSSPSSLLLLQQLRLFLVQEVVLHEENPKVLKCKIFLGIFSFFQPGLRPLMTMVMEWSGSCLPSLSWKR